MTRREMLFTSSLDVGGTVTKQDVDSVQLIQTKGTERGIVFTVQKSYVGIRGI